jgi:hypothetical protein
VIALKYNSEWKFGEIVLRLSHAWKEFKQLTQPISGFVVLSRTSNRLLQQPLSVLPPNLLDLKMFGLIRLDHF